jgi:hypothetical protein
MPREGMLIQVDGSYHRWLGKDGPQFTLLLAIDDATGSVVNALFCELENTRNYFSLLDGLIRRCGIPLALYADRHAVFKHTASPETAAGPTQFSRAMDELGIQLIYAQSPQAKGRVERAAGTFQDRLVAELRLAELRLAGATTIDDANRVLEDFLPRFNGRFKVPARESEAAYRTVTEEMCPENILCFKYRRRVARDNTVRYCWRTLQLLPGTDRPSYAGAAVYVLEGLDGNLSVQHEGRDIPSQEAPPRPSVLRGFAGRTAHSPITHHPSVHQRSVHKVDGQTGELGHQSRWRTARLHLRSQRDGTSSQSCDSAPEKAHAVADGQMESGAEGETQGTVHAWNRPGTGHTQRHGEEVHQRRMPTYGARSPDINDSVV